MRPIPGDATLDLQSRYAPALRVVRQPRQQYVNIVRVALEATEWALGTARALGEREDCLRYAVADLRGALRNLTPEPGPKPAEKPRRKPSKKPTRKPARKANPRR